MLYKTKGKHNAILVKMSNQFNLCLFLFGFCYFFVFFSMSNISLLGMWLWLAHRFYFLSLLASFVDIGWKKLCFSCKWKYEETWWISIGVCIWGPRIIEEFVPPLLVIEEVKTQRKKPQKFGKHYFSVIHHLHFIPKYLPITTIYLG